MELYVLKEQCPTAQGETILIEGNEMVKLTPLEQKYWGEKRDTFRVSGNPTDFYLVDDEEQCTDTIKPTGATVVCDTRGQALKPFKTDLQKIGQFQYFRVFFVAPTALVTVNFDRSGDEIKITFYKIETQIGTEIELLSSVWKGTTQSLPTCLQLFLPAINAAKEKATCSGCQHAHYAL